MVTITGGAKLDAYLRDLEKRVTKKAEVRVGFLEGATYPDGKPVAMIAAIQNFGAPSRGIPPRPFFSNMVADKSSEWGPALGAALERNDMDSGVALKEMGEGISGQLRQSIVDTNAPPLSPVTLLLRQRFGNNPQDIKFSDVQKARADIASGTKPNVTPTQAKTLVWTGHLMGSVDYELNTKGVE